MILWDLLTKRQEMAGYGDMDSQRVLPIAPIRNQFSGEQPTSYMSLHPVEDVGVSPLFYLGRNCS